jgi:hypothetical protein
MFNSLNSMSNLKKRMALATVLSTIATNEAMAKLANNNLNTILTDKTFQLAITIGFGLFAFWKWIEYFSSFSTGSALTGIIVPSLLTYLAFQWNTIISLMGLF